MPGPGEVPLSPLREVFAHSNLSVQAVADRAGMDWTHVNRALRGVPAPTGVKRGKRYEPSVYQTCSYRTAVRLAEAMGVDPWEVGI